MGGCAQCLRDLFCTESLTKPRGSTQAIAKEDADRFTERRAKMIAETRASATKQRMQRMQRAAEEEAKYNAAREEILDGSGNEYSAK
jgi:hypothetical protein